MRAEHWGDSFLEIEMRAKISVFLASKFEKNQILMFVKKEFVGCTKTRNPYLAINKS